jgi:hypothetical protein
MFTRNKTFLPTYNGHLPKEVYLCRVKSQRFDGILLLQVLLGLLLWFGYVFQKDPGVESMIPRGVLLGRGGTFRRWDSMRGLQVIKNKPLEEIVRPWSLLFLYFASLILM